MYHRIKTLIFIIAVVTGLVYLPAQAYLLSDDQSLWPVMSQRFSIPTDPDQIDIRHQIDLDLRHPKYIQRLTQNARPYLYYVFQETKKKHMPAELALLPMIESEYLPYGESRTGAAGLWQLMPSTANDYGVKMNSWYDGRRSTIASTKVALDFLSYLYQLFNHNWLLAIAAYDAGPGTVQAAIHYNREHGKPTDFWALHLPRETQVYIPKLLALAEIIQHPKTYGIHLVSVPNKPVTSTITIKKQMPIKTIAHLANTSVTTVKKLNPALRRSVTPPHQAVTLVLPANKTNEFTKQLMVQKTQKAQTAAKTLVAAHTTPQTHYVVKRGDNLWRIAHRLHMTRHNIARWNHLTAHSLLHEGQRLVIQNHKASKTTSLDKTKKHTVIRTNKHRYTVKRGDSLRVLARRHHTTIAHLMYVNQLHRSMLQIGQQLII